MYRLLSVALVIVSLDSSISQGALFLGPATFTTAPTSQMGTVTNNLTITNTPNGFVVTGQAIINLAGPAQGLLVDWVVERPLDPLYAGPFNLQTTTILDGFSSPPIGTFNSTAGVARSEFTSHPGSQSSIPVYLVNGVDTPPWSPAITVTSPTFTYTPGVGLTLMQHFFVDAVYTSGPGGNWVIDVPLSSRAFAVQGTIPEPSSGLLAAAGLVGGIAVTWRRRGLRTPLPSNLPHSPV
jgi:hypothetical protein